MMKTLILVTVFVILLGLGYCFVKRLDIRLTETRKRKGKLRSSRILTDEGERDD